MDIDLPDQTVTAGDRVFAFEIAPGTKRRLLEGLDEIGLTFGHIEAIDQFEKDRALKSFLFASTSGVISAGGA